MKKIIGHIVDYLNRAISEARAADSMSQLVKAAEKHPPIKTALLSKMNIYNDVFAEIINRTADEVRSRPEEAAVAVKFLSDGISEDKIQLDRDSAERLVQLVKAIAAQDRRFFDALPYDQVSRHFVVLAYAAFVAAFDFIDFHHAGNEPGGVPYIMSEYLTEQRCKLALELTDAVVALMKKGKLAPDGAAEFVRELLYERSDMGTECVPTSHYMWWHVALYVGYPEYYFFHLTVHAEMMKRMLDGLINGRFDPESIVNEYAIYKSRRGDIKRQIDSLLTVVLCAAYSTAVVGRENSLTQGVFNLLNSSETFAEYVINGGHALQLTLSSSLSLLQCRREGYYPSAFVSRLSKSGEALRSLMTTLPEHDKQLLREIVPAIDFDVSL